MTLGQKIKALRRDANITLRDLGKKVGVDFTYLSKIENDKTDNRPPSEDLLKKLAHELNADTDELMALAERIPDDIPGGKNALRFYRSLKGHEQDHELWDKLNKLVENQRKRKK